MRRLFLLGALSAFALVSLAQGQLSFEKETHDFGEVEEENGPITYSFSFVNTGDKPVKIGSVKASCGCTTPAWSKEVVAPKDTGFVTARYNPLNRPGRFHKSLNISFDNGAGNGTKTIYINGTVKPRPKTIEDELAAKIGNIRLKYKSLNFGKITTEKEVTESFDVYNDGESAISWKDETDLPDHIKVEFDPQTLDPKKRGKLIVSYDPNEKNDLGFISDNIKLYTTEETDGEKELFVIATIEEYFPPMSEEELAEAPKLSFDKVQFDFGKVNDGNIVEADFELTNTGKEKLLIRKTKENCSCTTAKLEKLKIKSGQTIKMTVRFDTSGRKGRQYKTVTVFSNDPTAPSQMITVKAEVE